MTTVQDVIDQGFAKSAAARPESISATGVLVTRVGICLQEVFGLLAREQPALLGTTAVVGFDGTGWPRPADCMRALKVQATATTQVVPPMAVGAEFAIVPFDDQAFCAGRPSLTELGQRFQATGQAIDPTGGNVSVIYARAPQVPTVTTDLIDALFPAFLIDLLYLDMALFLATQDKRTEDEQTFLMLKGAQVQLLLSWARGQTYDLQQRFPLVSPPLTNVNAGRQTPAEQ